MVSSWKDTMKRFVVKEASGRLNIIGTSGFVPTGSLCEAKDDWDAKNLIIIDGVVVHVEPNKPMPLIVQKQQQDSLFHVEHKVEKVLDIKKPIQVASLVLFLLLLGWALSKLI
jgi:hypothetical protein